MALDLNLDSARTSATETALASVPAVPGWLSWTQPKIKAKDRMFFTEQLSLLLATGTSLHPALLSIAAQMASSPMQGVVLSMADGVLNGRALSEEMEQQPHVFSPMYVNLVAASEHGGFLADILEQLCSIEQQNDELKSTLISSFSYPAFLVAFSIFTLAFVLLGVFPKFSELFIAIGDQLPGSTKILMAFSNFLLAHWIVVLASVCGLGVVLATWLKSTPGRYALDKLKLSCPGVKAIWVRVYLVLMLRILGMSLQHGVSLVVAVRTSTNVVNNSIVKAFLNDVTSTLEEGGRLTDGLARAPWLPTLTKQMLSTAEESGSLAPVMLRLSDYYNRELDRKLQSFSKMVEPIMLVVMGCMVGLLVSAMILPIFKLSHAVS